ncbi:vitronectin a [Takifugu flavidus]|uniref:Vitronectin n=1 Tax=Takifugu flavidus TaxID=433684 RepID=A0A5C6PBY5_9TELE|nr:vitronectin a [Takifugu flavidus]TWW77302.1 Vitronectin [Takifugu flavidus]
MRVWTILLFAPLALTFADEESCLGRCENGFDAQKKCQCDSMCKYYRSCCSDYMPVCGMLTRGDTFVIAEDDDEGELFEATTPSSPPANSRRVRPTQLLASDFRPKPHQETAVTLEITKPPGLMQHSSLDEKVTEPSPIDPQTTTVPATTDVPDPDAVVCSGRRFDSFMQVKNGSVFAFRGEYFFELDHKTVLPGYPKLIKDVWGISGPIDAAFTRYNCQGKTYIFKGSKYWRFDNGVLDDDYPRDISVGFDTIPDHIDAAFALPAPGHNGREKVYFFKGDQYYTYEFLHQPSHEECITMSERSPSTLFRHYTDVYYNNYESFLSDLFSNLPQHHDHHHFIDRDWKGLNSPVDAVMTGRMYVPSWRSTHRRNDYRFDQQYQQYQQYGQQWDQQYGQQWGRRRQSRSPFWGSMAERGMNMGQEMAERGMEMGLRLAEKRMELEERLGRDRDRMWDQDWDQYRRRDRSQQNNRGNYDSRRDRMYWDIRREYQPIQTVYFFKGEKYYRVDLRTKRVDPAIPPYPRSIAQYWLGCSGPTRPEK